MPPTNTETDAKDAACAMNVTTGACEKTGTPKKKDEAQPAPAAVAVVDSNERKPVVDQESVQAIAYLLTRGIPADKIPGCPDALKAWKKALESLPVAPAPAPARPSDAMPAQPARKEPPSVDLRPAQSGNGQPSKYRDANGNPQYQWSPFASSFDFNKRVSRDVAAQLLAGYRHQVVI